MPTPDSRAAPLILVTGATGFVGRHLAPALHALGYRVRCGSRAHQQAASAWPELEWCHLDLLKPRSIDAALEGATNAVYLVHSIDTGKSYPDRERRCAESFGEAAERRALRRIVYLGGVAPARQGSRHLESRLATGRLLRAGSTPAIELRAAMVLGHGSASWQMVRDLTVRMPPVLLPNWLDHLSSPVAIDDIVIALSAALALPQLSGCYDVPGPEVLSHRSLIERVAQLLGRRFPQRALPLVSPALSAYWVATLTRVPYALASELVRGLRCDLLPSDRTIWAELPAHAPRTLGQAIHDAFEDESSSCSPAATTRERIRRTLRALGSAIRENEG